MPASRELQRLADYLPAGPRYYGPTTSDAPSGRRATPSNKGAVPRRTPSIGDAHQAILPSCRPRPAKLATTSPQLFAGQTGFGAAAASVRTGRGYFFATRSELRPIRKAESGQNVTDAPLVGAAAAWIRIVNHEQLPPVRAWVREYDAGDDVFVVQTTRDATNDDVDDDDVDK